MNNIEAIKQGALSLGIRNGDTILMHSSLKSLGGDFKPSEVITGLLEALGGEGTLVLPSLSYEFCNKSNPHFDYYKTKSNIGAIPEYFRASCNAIRSMSPTHSCCAIGKNAEYVTEGHIYDDTPCGPASPFARVRDLSGKLLFLGCGMKPNTSMHAIEELSCPDYLFGDGRKTVFTLTNKNGLTYTKECKTHYFKNTIQRYDRLVDLLDCKSHIKGKIAAADCDLIDIASMWKIAGDKYIENPLFFVDIVE